MKNKKILIISGVILFILIAFFIVFLCVRTKKASKLEEMMIKDNSGDVISYIYNITNEEYDDVEKYILYAMDYYKYEKGFNSVNISDVTGIIKNVFNKDYSEEKILKVGMTPEMVNRNIMYDYEMKSFNINDGSISKKEIADTELKFYKIDSIRKRGNKYFVNYIEYMIESPYEILNYYNDLTEEYRSNSTVYNEDGEPVSVEAPVDAYDTTGILEYLNGEKSRKVLYDYINDELLDKIGNASNKIKVTYVVENDKLIIDKVETE
ncbi:MAG: hypothetical protein ACI4WW_03120 [Candidatus Coprovivens sp.]